MKTKKMDGLKKAKIVIMRHSDIRKCPHVIMVPEHYNNDGTCRCNDADHQDMKEWGYEWDGKSWIAPEEEDNDEEFDVGGEG
jgi:hypothetical protein|tara:strand:- start:183 stop:428 length:246 start_codon:yes stop_codon:yes gene_type:complete